MPKSKKPDNDSSGCILTFRVTPRSSRCSISQLSPGEFRARLTSPPVDGAANDQLVVLLAKMLGIARQNVEIISGTTSKIKRVRLTGVGQLKAEELLKN
jgi:uncharacterized protein